MDERQRVRPNVCFEEVEDTYILKISLKMGDFLFGARYLALQSSIFVVRSPQNTYTANPWPKGVV